MRTRDEILKEMPNDQTAAMNFVKAQVDVGQLQLEVLLDIRDLLTEKPKKGLLRK